MAELILLAGVTYSIWNISFQRHKNLNSNTVTFDNQLTDRTYDPVIGITYHPEQGRIREGTNLNSRYEINYAKRKERERRAATNTRIDPTRTKVNNQMQSTRTHFIGNAYGFGTYPDMSDKGRGRLLGDRDVFINQLPIFVGATLN
jgi:hypothetical protein